MWIQRWVQLATVGSGSELERIKFWWELVDWRSKRKIVGRTILGMETMGAERGTESEEIGEKNWQEKGTVKDNANKGWILFLSMATNHDVLCMCVLFCVCLFPLISDSHSYILLRCFECFFFLLLFSFISAMLREGCME